MSEGHAWNALRYSNAMLGPDTAHNKQHKHLSEIMAVLHVTATCGCSLRKRYRGSWSIGGGGGGTVGTSGPAKGVLRDELAIGAPAAPLCWGQCAPDAAESKYR
jgi:hypothetical protein